MRTVTLGGARLGSGNKLKVDLHGYERSTHNMGGVVRTTMAPGTLVPVYKQLATPGDTWEIDLGVHVMTHPTIGPLLGSYDIYIDVFLAEMRLYNSLLHQNQTNLGRNMSKVKLPQIKVGGVTADITKPIDNQQIHPSSILKYLGISGVGNNVAVNDVYREFNAIPFLMYWDIYKVFYGNKQEEIGMVIHRDPDPVTVTLEGDSMMLNTEDGDKEVIWELPISYEPYTLTPNSILMISTDSSVPDSLPWERFVLSMQDAQGNAMLVPATDLFRNWQVSPVDDTKILASEPRIGQWTGGNPAWLIGGNTVIIGLIAYQLQGDETDTEPKLVSFPLENLNTMRNNILQAPQNAAYVIQKSTNLAPYSLVLDSFIPGGEEKTVFSATFNQEGLAIKPFKSDKFNNWMNTEWIDGVGGINDVTSVDTSEGSFTISALILNRKLYDMMMRIGVSGGTADDWQAVVYDHKPNSNTEEPEYMGGLVRNIAFDEVISNSGTTDQPLGTLAGRGVMGNKHKGGKVVIKVDRPSYIMAIASIVPNIDYYQGNDWDMNLRTIDDMHKPALDQIGFQDSIDDERAWWSTNAVSGTIMTFSSAGKVPAWLDYQTWYNKVYGNFADQTQQGFMVLTRQYQPALIDEDGEIKIKDLTTYIDPSLFNGIFAYTRRDAQNFWVQVVVDAKVRRKMSASVMPQL